MYHTPHHPIQLIGILDNYAEQGHISNLIPDGVLISFGNIGVNTSTVSFTWNKFKKKKDIYAF